MRKVREIAPRERLPVTAKFLTSAFLTSHLSPVVTARPGHKIKLSKIDPDDTGGIRIRVIPSFRSILKRLKSNKSIAKSGGPHLNSLPQGEEVFSVAVLDSISLTPRFSKVHGRVYCYNRFSGLWSLTKPLKRLGLPQASLAPS